VRPRFLHDLYHSNEARLAAANSGWILAGLAISRLGKLAAVVVLARMLGPADFGLLGMAEAVVTLMGGLAGGGMQKVVIKHLVQAPEKENRILGTAFALRLALSSLAVLAALAAPAVMGLQQPRLPLLLFLLTLAWLPGALSNTTGAYFQSRLQDRRNVQSRDLATMGTALARCLAAFKGAPLWVYGALSTLGGLAWAWLGLRLLPSGWRQIFSWRFDRGVARGLWAECWPLIVWFSMSAIYNSVDRLMLGVMLGSAPAGEYVAAARVTRVCTLLPSLVLPSVFPYLIRLREKDRAGYDARFAQLSWIFTWAAVGLSALLSFPADWLMQFLYGGQYRGGGEVLAVLAWSNVLAFQAMVRGQWVYAEGFQRYFLFYAGAGTLINLGVNWLLIPLWGGMGAALATLASQVCAILLCPLIFEATRTSSVMLLKSFIPWPKVLSPRA
jgi:O-antigen/teichoic acid export membrane protein